jgi:hypothetical protein
MSCSAFRRRSQSSPVVGIYPSYIKLADFKIGLIKLYLTIVQPSCGGMLATGAIQLSLCIVAWHHDSMLVFFDLAAAPDVLCLCNTRRENWSGMK